MRRGGIRVVIITVVLLGIIVTGFIAYGQGETAGQNAASSDRSAFVRAGGTAVAGGQRTSGASSQAGGDAGSAVTGKVTKVDGGTITLQPQAGTTTTTVATNASTTVTTFASAALSDLATGDIVALQGDKTGDTTYTAKTIYALNAAQGRGAFGGSGVTAGTAAAGSPTVGGRNRAAASTNGGSPSGGTAGGALLPGLNGPIGRITQITGGTLTLQGFDGSTTTVTTNASTSVRKQTSGMVSDIKAGDTISIQGDPTAPARAIIDLGAVT